MGTVTVGLYGGLGNQMFQYAMARALTIRHDAALELDLYGFEFDRCYRREFELARFQLPGDVKTVRRPSHFRAGRVLRRLARTFPPVRRLARPAMVVESSPEFDPECARLGPVHGPAYVMGYWQDERYFRHCREALRADFSPARPLSEDNRRVAERIAETPRAVAVHVRGHHAIGRAGDPVSIAAEERKGVALPAQYYRVAVGEIERRLEDPFYFVFSDCPEWARRTFPGRAQCEFLAAGRGPDFEDLTLMRLCAHHVIANSSFSWWGAWLAESAGQVVVAPRPGQLYTPAIPEGWLRVGWDRQDADFRCPSPCAAERERPKEETPAVRGA